VAEAPIQLSRVIFNASDFCAATWNCLGRRPANPPVEERDGGAKRPETPL
jgi:hypothetical protein